MTDYNKLEKKEAKRDGVTPVRNSGRGKMKGDARSERFLIDYKFNALSFTLSLKNWIKLTKDAWMGGQKMPLICIKFHDGTKVGIIPWDLVEEIGLDARG